MWFYLVLALCFAGLSVIACEPTSGLWEWPLLIDFVAAYLTQRWWVCVLCWVLAVNFFWQHINARGWRRCYSEKASAIHDVMVLHPMMIIQGRESELAALLKEIRGRYDRRDRSGKFKLDPTLAVRALEAALKRDEDNGGKPRGRKKKDGRGRGAKKDKE